MLIAQYHLIGAHFVGFGLVKLFVDAVFVVIEGYLSVVFYCLVNEVNIVKKRRIPGFAPVAHRKNMLDMCFEIASAEFNQLVDEFPRVPCIDMTAAQHAVDENTQLRIFERSFGKITPLAGVHYVRPHFHKAGHIPAYRFSFRLYPVIFVQQVDYLALSQRMRGVRIFIEHLIKSYNKCFFRFQRHIPSPRLILPSKFTHFNCVFISNVYVLS